MKGTVFVNSGFEDRIINAIRASTNKDGIMDVDPGIVAAKVGHPPPNGNPPVRFKVDVDGVLFCVYVKNRKD